MPLPSVVKMLATRGVAKSVIGFVAAGGASLIAKEIIANNIDEPETLIGKIKVAAGVVVVAGIVRDASKAHTDKKIDQIADFVTEVNEKLHETKATEEPSE